MTGGDTDLYTIEDCLKIEINITRITSLDMRTALLLNVRNIKEKDIWVIKVVNVWVIVMGKNVDSING